MNRGGGRVFQDYRLGIVLLLLLVAVIALPYILRASPRSIRDWHWVAAAVAFLLWLLAGVQILRAGQ
jgi:hypothetical protein